MIRRQEPVQALEPGFEGLAQACGLARSSPTLEPAAEPRSTLTLKRAALAERPVAAALETLRRWLDGPAPSPSPVTASDGIRPLVSSLQALQKALAVRQYVLLADGRCGAGIDSLQEGLRLADAVSGRTLIGWTTGLLVSAKLSEALAAHADQFAVADCERVVRLAQAWAQGPDALPSILERSRLWHRQNLPTALAPAQIGTLIEGLRRDGDPLADTLAKLPAAQAPVLAERALDELDLRFDYARRSLRIPYWQKLPPPPAEPSDPLVRWLASQGAPRADSYRLGLARRQAYARLLACRAALQRHRWNNETYPPKLALLRLGEMIVDPFTSEPFGYSVEKDRYRLECGGLIPG